MALWCAHSHALDLAWFNPRLAICSPVKRCGKTTLVEVLSGLVARAKPTSGVTPSVVFRMIDKWHPTYLIDEADGYLPDNEELRSVLNRPHPHCRFRRSYREQRRRYARAEIVLDLDAAGRGRHRSAAEHAGRPLDQDPPAAQAARR